MLFLDPDPDGKNGLHDGGMCSRWEKGEEVKGRRPARTFVRRPNALPSTRLSQISPKDETLDEDDFDDMAKEGMATISIMAYITVHKLRTLMVFYSDIG